MSTNIVQSSLQVMSQAKGDATLTQTSLTVIGRASGAKVNQASLTAIGRASGAKVNQVTADFIKQTLEPSVRIASIYFKVEHVSLREVFNKTGGSSLIALIENEP